MVFNRTAGGYSMQRREMLDCGVRYLFIWSLLSIIAIRFVGGCAEVPPSSSSLQSLSINGTSITPTNHNINGSSPVALLTQTDSNEALEESLLDMLGLDLDSSVSSGRSSDGDVGSAMTTTSDTYMNQMVWDDDNIFNEVDYRNMVTVSDPSSHTRSESLPASHGMESNVEANDTMTVVPSSSTISSSPGITRIFGVPVSSFKGFGLTVEKSVVKWSACGMAIRVPISSHFPEYDKNQNLPRLSGSMGITYPYGYKVSVKAKFNIKSAVSGILSMLNSTGVRTAGDLYNAYKRQKASDSLQQFGATFTLHYVEKKFRFTVGPWVSYIPGLAVMTQHVLPILFFMPAVVIALLGLFLPLSLMEEEVTQLWNDVLTAVEHESQHRMIGTSSSTSLPVSTSSISTISTPAVKSSSDTEHITPQQSSSHSPILRKTIKRTYVRGRGIKHWHQRLLQWGSRKTTGLGYDFGWKYQGLLDHHPSLGSRIYFEIQPFFPLAKSWKWFSTMTCDSFEWIANFLKNVAPSIREKSPPIVSSSTENTMSWHEDVLWLPEVSRLGGNNIQTTKNREDTTTTQNEEETAPRSPMILPPTTAVAASMVSSIRK